MESDEDIAKILTREDGFIFLDSEETEEIEDFFPTPEPWVYKPSVWDHEELHLAYSLHTIPNTQPEDMEITLLDTDGKETPVRHIRAAHENDLFEMDNAQPVRFVNFRYITTNCEALCREHVADHRFLIMVSVRRWENIDIPEECYIHNFFIQPESAERALDILNFFQFHVYEYLRRQTIQERPEAVHKFIHPKLLRDCTVKIHWRKLRKTWTEKRTVVLDPECVIFYRKRFEDAHEPRDRMFFWYEQFRKTVCKVSRIKSENCILLHSLFMYIVIQYDDTTGPDVEAAFKKVKAVPRKAFQEPEILFHWLDGSYDPETNRILPPPVPEPEPLQIGEEQAQKLDQFEKELNEGLFRGTDDQSQMIWNNMRPHLEQTLVDAKLVNINERELCADLDPNSVDSLLHLVSKIERELFHNVDYDKALAIVVAMKSFFEKSQVERLQKLLAESPVDILHKIHARRNTAKKVERAEPDMEEEEDDDDVCPEVEEDISDEEEEGEVEEEGEEEMEVMQEQQ